MRENEDVRTFAFLLLILFALPGFAPAQETPPAGEIKTPPVSLSELSQSLEGLVNRVRPAVVQIFSTGYVTADESDSSNTAALLSQQRSTGSGIRFGFRWRVSGAATRRLSRKSSCWKRN
jgi:hypothetical protein